MCNYVYTAILYPELSFLLRYTPSLSTLILQDFLSNLETVKKNELKIVLIIVNINKDENKSLISNQFSVKNDCIDKSKNTKFTGLNTFYVGKQV